MSNIEQRIEKALYYKELLAKTFFAKKRNEVTAEVEAEIKQFVNDRLSDLLGINRENEIKLTQEEISQLKTLLKSGKLQVAKGSVLTGSPQADTVENDQDVVAEGEEYEEYETPDGRMVKIRKGALKPQAVDPKNKPLPMPSFEQKQALYIAAGTQINQLK